VNAINDAPKITVLAGSGTQSSCLGYNKGRITLKLSDADNDPSTLALNAASSNTSLLPKSNVTFSGSGETRTATITTHQERTGTSTVTITLTDGQMSASSP